ncbi:MAG: M24 family metallopeptidase [Planctomycetota bacterium]
MDNSKPFELEKMQAELKEAGLDGWLFYDFRGLDPIAHSILRFSPGKMGTRRWFFFVPAEGEPSKLVHAIEAAALDHLPGSKIVYGTRQSLDAALQEILSGSSKVAMNYATDNPYVSRVDAGTVEKVRSKGVEVVTSGELIQIFESVLSPEQLESHRRAGAHIRGVVDEVFALVGDTLRAGRTITERDICDYANKSIREGGFENDHDPIVGVNEHAADPHFEVPAENSAEVRPGDLLLFDVWAKETKPGSIYADITWCAFIGSEPPAEMLKVFNVVRDSRKAACERAHEAFSSGEEIRGCDLDRVTRGVITEAGYGEYFVHRTGHSLHECIHGNGAHLDDFETYDDRKLIPGTLFTVEPGIYMPEKRIGIRSEVDVYHTGQGAEVTGPPHQEELVRIEI